MRTTDSNVPARFLFEIQIDVWVLRGDFLVHSEVQEMRDEDENKGNKLVVELSDEVTSSRGTDPIVNPNAVCVSQVMPTLRGDSTPLDSSVISCYHQVDQFGVGGAKYALNHPDNPSIQVCLAKHQKLSCPLQDGMLCDYNNARQHITGKVVQQKYIQSREPQSKLRCAGSKIDPLDLS